MTAALTIDGIGVAFAGVKAVDDVSLIDRGRRAARAARRQRRRQDHADGPGLRQDPEHRGQGLPLRHRHHQLEEHRIARAGIGRKFQIPSVFRD